MNERKTQTPRLSAQAEEDIDLLSAILTNAVSTREELKIASMLSDRRFSLAFDHLISCDSVYRLPTGAYCYEEVYYWLPIVTEQFDLSDGTVTTEQVLNRITSDELCSSVTDKNEIQVLLDYLRSDPFRPKPVPVDRIIDAESKLREPVVDGLFRVGDIANVIAATKVGKSWMALGLAFAVAQGNEWMGFKTNQGRVLIIDNELERSDLDERIEKVVQAAGFNLEAIGDNFQTDCLRGRLRDLDEMEGYFSALKRDYYRLIILDSLYRFFPRNFSENDNADVTNLYNTLTKYAKMTGAAIAPVHHSSKGNQSTRQTTDVGSGAAAMARAADCHLAIRRHELENHAVLDAAVRTFEPIERFSVKWDWPLWSRSDQGAQLAVANTHRDHRQSKLDREGVAQVVTYVNSAKGSVSCNQFRTELGINRDRAKKLFRLALGAKAVELDRTEQTKHGNTVTYVRQMPPEQGNEETIDDLF